MAVETTAVVVPGKGYTTYGPLLYYTRLALLRRGAQVRALEWSPPPYTTAADAERWVVEQVEPYVIGADRPLLVGKSLGTFAASTAARDGLAAVWFTPLLTAEPVVAALRKTTAPALLVGGTADRLWDGGLARSLSAQVCEIPDGDHNLLVPGPIAESARVLGGEVMTAVEEFLDTVC